MINESLRQFDSAGSAGPVTGNKWTRGVEMGDKGKKDHDKSRKQDSVKKEDKVQKARVKSEKNQNAAPLGGLKRKG